LSSARIKGATVLKSDLIAMGLFSVRRSPSMVGRSHHNVGLSRGFEVLTPRSRISQSPFIFEYVGLKSEFAGISSLTKSKREHLKLYFLLKILTLKLYDNADALVKNCAYVIVLGMNFNLMEK